MRAGGGSRYNGKLERIRKFDSKSGLYYEAITKSKDLLIKPTNLQKATELIRKVGRVNINGGGTLIGDPDEDVATILSFEWLDAAEPAMDFAQPSLADEEFSAPSEEDSDDLLEKRSQFLEEFTLRTPSIESPPDCDPDMSPIQTPRRQAFDAYSQKFADRLVRESGTDLLTFRSTLMEQPLLLWHSDANMLSLIRDKHFRLKR
jgi:hypothetical protein